MISNYLPLEEGFALTMAQAMNYSMLRRWKVSASYSSSVKHTVYSVKNKLYSYLWQVSR